MAAEEAVSADRRAPSTAVELEPSVSVAPPVERNSDELTRRVPAAKLRILEASTILFSREGIRAVGVDRLIQQSSVTKATFYKHFGSKDRLIRDYLSGASTQALAELDRLIHAQTTPQAALFAIVDAVHATLRDDGFQGSLFVNAAAEFPDPRDPVRVIIAEHHEAIASRITELLQRIGHPLPGETSDQLMMAYVGALSWGHVGDPIGASTAFRRSVECVLGSEAHAA